MPTGWAPLQPPPAEPQRLDRHPKTADGALTTGDLRAELPDVAPATLYRHVARLVDAGVLAVVAERRVRAATERTYVLRVSAAAIGLDELEHMTADDHRQAFMAFVAGLLADFDRYVERDDIDLLRDGVTYRPAGLWLDDAEFREFLHELARVLQPGSRIRPGAGGAGESSAPSCSPATTPPGANAIFHRDPSVAGQARRGRHDSPDSGSPFNSGDSLACGRPTRWWFTGSGRPGMTRPAWGAHVSNSPPRVRVTHNEFRFRR